MTYKNLTNYAPADKADVFKTMRDFLCKLGAYTVTGIGWTLHDSYYAVDSDNPQANDWIVIYSPGESGDEDLYFYIKWISNAFYVWGYQSWDPATHAGANKYGTTNTFSVSELAQSTTPLWIYADLDIIQFIHEYTPGVQDYRGNTAGKLHPTYEDYSGVVATCSTSLGAGSDVSIVLDAIPPEWDVDDEVFIRTIHTDNMATVEIEKITIKTIVSNTITADLVNSYTTGAKLANHVGYFAQDSTNSASTTKALIGPNGAILQAVTHIYNTTYAVANYDPEAFNRTLMLYVPCCVTTTGAVGIFTHLKRTPAQNAEFTNLDTVITKSGVTYRFFKLYSVIYVAIKEV